MVGNFTNNVMDDDGGCHGDVQRLQLQLLHDVGGSALQPAGAEKD